MRKQGTLRLLAVILRPSGDPGDTREGRAERERRGPPHDLAALLGQASLEAPGLTWFGHFIM